MKMHGDIQIAEHIFSVKDSVPLLHINKLDGENVSGIFQLLRSQNQRRLLLVLAPPLHSACNLAQGSKRRIPQNAEQIQIRIFRMKFPFSRGAVENHAYEVLARCRPHLLNKFAEQLLVRHYSSLPASQASKTSAADKRAVKATAAAKSASAPSSAAVPTVSAAAKQKPPEYQPPERSKQYNQNNYYK